MTRPQDVMAGSGRRSPSQLAEAGLERMLAEHAAEHNAAEEMYCPAV
jgi:hypothetical protein